MPEKRLLLIYDGQCPVCSRYGGMLRFKENQDSLQLIDARTAHPILAEVEKRRWNLDEGMVFVIGENWFYGSDAVHALALLSSRSGYFNKLNYLLFRSKTLCTLLYPVLKQLRVLLLLIRGKPLITEETKLKSERKG